jgi:hypothetical protein
LIEEARTLINTSSSAGAGFSISLNTRTDGDPYLSHIIAFTFAASLYSSSFRAPAALVRGVHRYKGDAQVAQLLEKAVQGGLIGEGSREHCFLLADRLDIEAFEPISVTEIESALNPDPEFFHALEYRPGPTFGRRHLSVVLSAILAAS